MGDFCDNCRFNSNQLQLNVDNDNFGDVCDPDIDNDGVDNNNDNCPNASNRDQSDRDGDTVGDACDNCMDVSNTDQIDRNHNRIGDACEDAVDSDHDGIPVSNDNCPSIINADQADADSDGRGDDCDPGQGVNNWFKLLKFFLDADNDGIKNEDDNCPLVPNPDQADFDYDGIGDSCTYNYDGDGTDDPFDNCPKNGRIEMTDFRAIQAIAMGENEQGQEQPIWTFKNEGKEIHQKLNSAPGIAIGDAQLSGVDFEGTFFVDTDEDGDWIGFIFSFQAILSFYLQANH